MYAGDKQVIAFGAGSLLHPEDQAAACRNALVVYLKLSAKLLWQRIENCPANWETRPNLSCSGHEEVVEISARRTPGYCQCTDLIVDSTLTPEDLSDVIVAAYKEREMGPND